MICIYIKYIIIMQIITVWCVLCLVIGKYSIPTWNPDRWKSALFLADDPWPSRERSLINLEDWN